MLGSGVKAVNFKVLMKVCLQRAEERDQSEKQGMVHLIFIFFYNI